MKLNNFAHVWCTAMIERLIDLGADHFFIAPGSRSTPLVSAIVRHERAKKYLGIDERSLAFMAQGYGKAKNKPGCIVVTSGTAVANLYPAVAEAFLSQVPLLILSADRPFELRDCGANQTMFQTSMFSHHINKNYDLPPPLSTVPLNLSQAIFDQAYRATMEPKKGPVHLNIQLREPLANLPHGDEIWDEKEISTHLDVKPPRIFPVLKEIPSFFSQKAGLIVVGELHDDEEIEQILSLSQKLQWPIYADITSNIRLRDHEMIMHRGDLALLNDAFFSNLSFDVIVKFGGRIVSKRCWSFIDQHKNAQKIAISNSCERIDHVGAFTHWYLHNIAAWLQFVHENVPARNSFFTWHHYRNIVSHVDRFLESDQNNEAFYAARLVSRIKKPSVLFLSSSMPIRDVDQFAKPSRVFIKVYSNRGVSGIDGVISSAVGVAIAHQMPTVLLIGDVAFLHDTNGLMLLKSVDAPIFVVVINNGGGGIFHFLPIAKEEDIVTPFLDTPHNVSLKALSEAHHINFKTVENPHDFDASMRDFYETPKTTIIEVIINRSHNINAHHALYRSLKECV